MKNKYTIMGYLICNQREKPPIYTGSPIAETDLFFYQVCNAYDLVGSECSWKTYWFPTCYVYVNSTPIVWVK